MPDANSDFFIRSFTFIRRYMKKRTFKKGGLLRRDFICAGASLLFSGFLRSFGFSGSSPVRVFSVTDIHCDVCENEGSKNYRASLGKLKKAVSAHRSQKFDFVLNLGDIVDRNVSCADTALSELSSLGVPLKNVLGNHDFRCSPSGQRAMAKKLFCGGNSYYSFDCGIWRFIVLDSMGLSRISKIKDADCAAQTEMWISRVEGKPNSVPWGGGIDSRQLAWLESELKKSSAESRPAAVLCHMTAYPLSHASMFNYEEVGEMLSKYRNCAKAFICGHKHDGGYEMRGGLHYLALKSLLEYEEPTYSVLNFYKDKIVVEGFGEETPRVLMI